MEDAMNFNNSEKSIMKFDHFKSFTMLFRLIELCFGLLWLSWTSTRLPLLIQISCDYLRLAFSFFISPLFIFLLGNFIVLTLLLKSGRLSGQSPITCHAAEETKIYNSLIQNTHDYSMKVTSANSDSVTEPPEIVYQDKQTISDTSTLVAPNLEDSRTTGFEQRVPRKRTRSDELNVEKSGEESCGKLQRTVTEKCRKVTDPSNAPTDTALDVENLSNEEFQRAIEDFIAKQIKFHQEEKLDIVLQSS
ncbi:PREDICTED: uncharacterized protein LOC109168363 [Ipomoea nil]|uniref:uncharacterized protein LOC109168363 n=1 Tax=Ipomoea nil TaxID=35883 RepID=UPI000901A947|nr:PREDICTED: uncharacterized protein LOC109168363 [Ipomoea nil]